MKKIFITLSLLIVAAFVMPSTAMAEEQTCTTTYGQGVVCGVKTPPTEIEAGLAEDLRVFGAVALLASGALYVNARRKYKAESV